MAGPDSENDSATGVWQRDTLTSRVYLSSEWKALLGYEDHELPSDFNEFQSRLHPEDHADIIRTLHEQAAQGRFELPAGLRLRHRDGSFRWLHRHSDLSTRLPARDTTQSGKTVPHTSTDRYAAWLASFPEDNPNPIVELDLATGAIHYLNPSGRRLFPSLEMEGLRHPFLIGLREQAAATTKPEMSRRDVTVGQACFAQTIYHLPDVNRTRVYGIDVTERKRAEQAVQLNEQRCQDFFDNTHDLIQSVAPDGRLLLANRAWRETFGYSEAEVQSLTVMDLVHPDSRADCGALFRDIIAQGKALPMSAAFVTKIGERVLVEGNATPRILDGQVTAVHCSLRNVTAQHRSENQLRLQAAALDAAANEVVITDRHGVIEWVNPAFSRTTGYTLTEVAGQNPRVLKSGKHDEAFYKHLWGTILRGEVWRGEMTNRRKDGSLFTEEAMITPVRGKQGEITHFIAIKQDISEKKLLEAKFLRAQRLEGLGALAGGVAHDLNNVLAPVLMAAELLKSQAPDPQTRHLLEMIEKNSQRGAAMIRQILAFARGTAGEKIVLQVTHLLKEISKMLKDTFPPAIQCELHVAKDVPTVLGDATALYQVLLNLCVNARDAMPKGGLIKLSAENATLDQTCSHQCQAAPPGNYLVLTVADTGSGIPPEIRDKIFQPFFTTKEPGKGTGLGLATVNDIVRNHSGFIHLYSEVGVGTQFKIYLPALVATEATEDSTLITLPTGQGELVLVVDDEAAVREIVKATLENYGYRVLTANDGTEAVARFVEHLKEVKLLLTDMQMPHMDGAATIRALRNIQPELRIIAASGLSTHEAALKATGLEVQGFVAKPFTAANLLLALDAALERKSPTTG